MPELPEVEITRRGVEQRFLNSRLAVCTVRQPRLRWPVPVDVQRCEGQRLQKVWRRSKYLIAQFERDALVIHLGMSGSLKIVDPSEPWATHDHIEWRFDEGCLRYNDPRRFGSVEWVDTQAGEQWVDDYKRFSRLGPEPFSEAFTVDGFYRDTRGKTLSIKALLLSGLAVVGVGNIYACEALFRSRIRPGKAAGRLTKNDLARLHQAVREVLGEAIARGGSTLRNFQAIDGELGHFQLHCDVYGREGEPCKQCGNAIRRRVMAQRSTFYCSACQR